MPWCADCDRFLSPPTVREDGTCPTCGKPVEVGAYADAAAESAEENPPVPFHLKALGAATVIYLGYRALQGVSWVAHKF